MSDMWSTAASLYVENAIYNNKQRFNFSALSEHTLGIEYHVYIWQVSPQLSCGGTCQIYMWFKESKRYYCQIEHFASGETNERNFSNPLPRTINHQLAMVSKPSEYINALCQILYSFCCAKRIIACKHQPNVHSCNKQLRTYDLITLKWGGTGRYSSELSLFSYTYDANVNDHDHASEGVTRYLINTSYKMASTLHCSKTTTAPLYTDTKDV